MLGVLIYFFFKINSLAQLILGWHSWIAHVVTLFLTKAIGLPLPTIYRFMCSSGRGNVGSPMLCILLSQKLVLVKVVTLHIPIIGRWIIKDGGAKMDTTQIWWNVVNKPYIVLLKNMALSGTPFFLWITLRDLESWNYGALSFSFLCLWAGQFFYSIAPCLLSLKDFGGYV